MVFCPSAITYICFCQKRRQWANMEVGIFTLAAMADFWNKTDEMQERSIAVRQTQ